MGKKLRRLDEITLEEAREVICRLVDQMDDLKQRTLASRNRVGVGKKHPTKPRGRPRATP